MSSWGSAGIIVTFNSNSFTLNGTTDFLIVKHNSTGDELWVKQFGSNFEPFMHSEQFDGISTLIYDPFSNCLILFGSFVSACNFGTVSLYSSPHNYQDVFIAKFDLEGNFIWVKKAGSDNMNQPSTMSIDNEGNAYVLAMFPYGGNFDTIHVPNSGHLAKYDPEGNVLWVKKIFTNLNVGLHFPLYFLESKTINESLYLTGYNIKSEFTVDTISMSIPDYSDQLIANFDLDGNIKWLKAIGGPIGTSLLKEIDSDDLENIYIPGAFSGSYATFGIDTIFLDTGRGIYVAKYNKEGTLVWLKHAVTSNPKKTLL